MTILRAPVRERTRPPRPRSGLFRAFWRWHFYASFLVIPVLLVLAVTGLIYLFRFQLEPLLHADLMRVERRPATPIAAAVRRQLAAVEREFPDATVVSMTEPREAGRSTVFSVVAAGRRGRGRLRQPVRRRGARLAQPGHHAVRATPCGCTAS